MAVQELNHLIPNFQKKIDQGLPEDLDKFYAEVCNICAIYIDLLTESRPASALC